MKIRVTSLLMAVVMALGVLAVANSTLLLRAQSVKKAGVDVSVQPYEQWQGRRCFVTGSEPGDIGVERDGLNVLRVTDCTDTANLRDMKMRNNFLTSSWHSGPMMLGGQALGAAGSEYYTTKTVTGLADATFTDLFTVTVPNAANSATIPLLLNGILGAGGTVGAGECTATAYGQLVVARTAGLATVASAVALSNAGTACVAGATTIALAYQVSSITGANGATQTFTIQGRVTKGAGSSANHVVLASASLLNWGASGITIS